MKEGCVSTAVEMERSVPIAAEVESEVFNTDNRFVISPELPVGLASNFSQWPLGYCST